MAEINPANVLDLLAKELGAASLSAATSSDYELKDKLMDVISSFMHGETEEEEALDWEEEHGDRNEDDDFDDTPEASPEQQAGPSTSEYEASSPIKIGQKGDPYPGDQKNQEILNYWRDV